MSFEDREYRKGDMLVFGSVGKPTLVAVSQSIVMLLGGKPIGQRHMWWNFVSSRKERIEQAKADWKAGRFKLPDHDAEAFIPLPDATGATAHVVARDCGAGADALR